MTAAATPGREELLACPFCGHAAMTSGNPSDKYEPAINIHCSGCNVEGGWFYGVDCVDRATKQWNTRLAAKPADEGVCVWLREVDSGTDNACWVVCNRIDPGAIEFASTTGEPKR